MPASTLERSDEVDRETSVIGRRIVEARHEGGLDQPEIAAQVDIDTGSLGRRDTDQGSPPSDRLPDFASLLSVSTVRRVPGQGSELPKSYDDGFAILQSGCLG